MKKVMPAHLHQATKFNLAKMLILLGSLPGQNVCKNWKTHLYLYTVHINRLTFSMIIVVVNKHLKTINT